MQMFSKFNQKGQRTKLIIPQIKNRESSKPRSLKKQLNESNQYETDQKRNVHQSNQTLDELKEILSSCNNCKSKVSQFVTKKPTHLQQKSTQTTHKPFLIDLIQERVQNICRQNGKLTRLLEERQEELIERQQEVNQIQDKFTSILLNLSQQIAKRRRQGLEWYQMSKGLTSDSDTPAYMKALQYELN